MSRSYRKVPVTGYAIADSEKKDKRFANRKLRRMNKVIVTKDEDPEPVDLREVSQVYAFAKDGKQWIEDPEPKHMRK